MAEELLSLKWNNHQAHFVDILTFLREQEIFVDATLACGGKLYPAHKFVLSTCSEYFKQMFTRNPNKHPIVFMKDVSCRDLEALLDFMYNGEVNVPQSSLGSLIKTAEGLQIKGLAVPDDPPISKKDIPKEKKDKLSLDQYLSPPPKRLKVRERSPVLTSSASLLSNTVHSQNRTKSPPLTNSNAGCSSLGLPIEAIVDEDSRTSAQSGFSEHSQSHPLNTRPIMNSIAPSNDESADNCDKVLHSRTSDEPSPGPSGLHKAPHSKEEELDIKQEDVVDLEDEDGEWGTTEGDGIDGGGDASLGSDNAHFSDSFLHPNDSSLPSTGDHAMGQMAPDFGLQHHLLVTDEEILRPHQCAFCGRRFKRKDHRVEHERIHTGERPFACYVCGRAFVQKHQLVSHIKRKHSAPASASATGSDSGPVSANFFQPECLVEEDDAYSHSHTNS